MGCRITGIPAIAKFRNLRPKIGCGPKPTIRFEHPPFALVTWNGTREEGISGKSR
jgi:hypothetical protein